MLSLDETRFKCNYLLALELFAGHFSRLQMFPCQIKGSNLTNHKLQFRILKLSNLNKVSDQENKIIMKRPERTVTSCLPPASVIHSVFCPALVMPQSVQRLPCLI